MLVSQLMGIYPAMRQPFASFEKRITGSKAFGRNELAKLLLQMIKQFLTARQGDEVILFIFINLRCRRVQYHL